MSEMVGEKTPGGLGRVRCPRCGETVFFTMGGGPHSLACPSCKSSIDLDVVHDGRKWTLRRIRGPGGPAQPPPP